MAEKKTAQALEDIKDVTGEVAASTNAPAAPAEKVEVANDLSKRVKKRDELGRSYGTGRRKDAVARVWVKPGSGKIVVNGKSQDDYFARQTHRLVINQPFLVAGCVNQFDVMCTVKGGGQTGQAGAVRHGICRALAAYEPEEYHTPLKRAGFMTRDSRVVERKKIGLHKARRSKQWAKR